MTVQHRQVLMSNIAGRPGQLNLDNLDLSGLSAPLDWSRSHSRLRRSMRVGDSCRVEEYDAASKTLRPLVQAHCTSGRHCRLERGQHRTNSHVKPLKNRHGQDEASFDWTIHQLSPRITCCISSIPPTEDMTSQIDNHPSLGSQVPQSRRCTTVMNGCVLIVDAVRYSQRTLHRCFPVVFRTDHSDTRLLNRA